MRPEPFPGVTAVFKDPADAEHAVTRLREAGFASARIRVAVRGRGSRRRTRAGALARLAAGEILVVVETAQRQAEAAGILEREGGVRVDP